MAHRSLYRRYRPRRFSELRGQDHVVRALTNAMANDTVGHAYLFSGPRGTGKTSAARILARALNCTNPVDGEPCGECESCTSIEAGSSYDLVELDAASNNRVETMRDLVAGAAVGSPGQRKVYILDEVHMLSAGAANTLLKTLEEPPPHVVFVLATTDPHKVLPTIRSRTQHFEFSLLSAEELTDYVRWIVADADLTVDDDTVARVVRAGRGSARDTLSALDQAVAAGGIDERPAPVDEIVAAVAGADPQRAIVALAKAMGAGSDPRVLGEALLGALRDAFLVTVGADVSHLSEADREAAGAVGADVGAAPLTRALEAVGAALVEMRQATDPRIPLEVALIRVSRPTETGSVDGLESRLSRLERKVDKLGAEGPAPAAPAKDRSGPPPPPRRRRSEAAAQAPPPAAQAPPASAQAPPPAAQAPPPAAQAPGPRSEVPTPEPDPPAPTPAAVDDLSPEVVSRAMADSVLASLKGIAKAIYQGGRVVTVDAGTVVFALGNAPTRDRAEKVRPDVEAALAAHFGHPVPLRLVDEKQAATMGSPGAAASGGNGGRASAAVEAPADAEADDEHPIDVTDLADATGVSTSATDKLTEVFPGAVVVEEEA